MAHAWQMLIAAYCGYLVALGRPESTIGLRRDQLRQFAKYIDTPPRRVTYDTVLGFFTAHAWAPETRRSFRSALRGFFTWAQDNGHLEDNPIARMPQVRVPKSTVRACPEDVYAAALARADARGKLILRCAAEAGLRRGEIARLHRRDVRRGPAGWEVLVHGKGSNERIVPLHDGLAVELSAAPGWVFPAATGGHLTPQTVGDIASDLLGPEATLHQLRHRFATKAYRGSRNLRAVQQLLGHSNLAVTERYIDCDEAERRAAMLSAIA